MNALFLGRTILCIVAATVATAAAAGERWRYLEPQPATPVWPSEAWSGVDGALWLVDALGVHRTVGGAAAGFLPTPPSRAAYESGKPLADGGAVLKTSAGGCELERVDAALQQRWAHRFAAPCDYAVNADGTIWMLDYGSDLYKLGGDGRLVARVDYPQRYPYLAAMPDGGAVVAGATYEASWKRSHVVRYGSDGAARWTFVRDGLALTGVAAGANGTITAAGSMPAPGLNVGTVTVLRFDAGGTLLQEYAGPAQDELPVVVSVALDGSASVVAVSYRGFDNVYVDYRFGADGRFLWRRELCIDVMNGGHVPSAVPLSGGALAVACGSPQASRYERYDAAGGIAATTPLAMTATRLRVRPDGLFQVLGEGIGLASGFVVVDADGRPAAVPALTMPLPRNVYDAQFRDDGSTWLLWGSPPAADRSGEVGLSRVQANGSLAWSRAVDVAAANPRVVTAGGQPCITGTRQPLSPWPQPGFPPQRQDSDLFVVCLAAADGVERWRKTFPRDLAEHWFGGLADGSVVHVRSEGPVYEVIRYDGAGNEVARDAGTGRVRSVAIDPAGAVMLGAGDADVTTRYLVRHDGPGAGRRIDLPPAYGVEVLDATDDGALVLVHLVPTAGATSDIFLQSFARDGRLLWSHAIDSPVESTSVLRAGDAVYLVEAARLPWDEDENETRTVRVSRLSAQDGAVTWQRMSAAPLLEVPSARRLPLAVSGNQLVLAREGSRRLGVLRYDVRDGTSLDDTLVPCDRYCGAAIGVALDGQGTARVALPVADDAHGRTAGLVALGDTSALPPIRLDQPGLAGAWWSPYANGEGFVVDWLPASRTWFMPWFTYAREGGNDPAGQRWYAVAGQIAAGAAQAELPILETTGGTFDTGGGVTSRQVGKATLRFTDCDNGTLRYAFDAGVNGGAAGTITLSRLSAATQDCVRADGSVQTRTTEPANGFDARMSGSWYEEATSGQGLQLVVQPRGVFFAPWFTFDPAGTTEPADPGRQRWYALQGALASAVAGRAELAITQAIGGAFDRVPTSNQFVVGAATLTMTACDRAMLDYRFDTNALAGDMAGRSGSIDLTKIGGCAP